MHKVKLSLEYTDLLGLIDKIIERHEELAAEKGIMIRSEYGPMKRIKINSGQMQRVIENLLGNAIRFAQESGKIVIEIKDTDREVII